MANNQYYTNVSVIGNNICYRGIKDGRRFSYKYKYSPNLYVRTHNESKYKTIFGENLEKLEFIDIREAKNFINSYSEVDNFPIYGNKSFEYAYIADEHKDEIDWKFEDLLIAVCDIETYGEGFPDVDKADHPITAITIRYFNLYSITFACGEYKVKSENIKYVKCDDEYDLLNKFTDYWYHNCPDIVTGWNIQGFDIPYLYNRIFKLCGEDIVKKLSPWQLIRKTTKYSKTTGKDYFVYKLYGLSVLDYHDLYKAFVPVKQESYKLDDICNFELDIGKLNFEEYGSIRELYVNNFDKFIDYNIIDCELIEKLENKLNLIELSATLAYDTKSQFEDVFTQTRMWDAITYTHLLSKNIIVPEKKISSKDEKFEGAYVKEPIVGKYENLVTFDLESLYPNLIEQYNLSPDTLIEPENYTSEMRQIISRGVTVEKLLNREIDLSKLKNVVLTPSGQFFRIDKKGFLAEIVSQMKYDRKVKYKKLMLETEKQLENAIATENISDESRIELEKKIARYKKLQLAKKVQANSGFGTLGSAYFRFFDVRIAEAITACGQLSIKWIENSSNILLNKLADTKDVPYCLYSDTDSIFFNLDKLVQVYKGDKSTPEKVVDILIKICDTIIQPYIQKSYQNLFDYVGGYDNTMYMKREKICTHGILTGKKHYVLYVYDNEGIRYAEPQIVIVGLEMIKSSTPIKIREELKKITKIILVGTEEEVQQYILNYKKEFKKLSVEDVAFPRGVNGIKEYSDSISLYKKGTPIHTKAAILHNNMLRLTKTESKYPKIQDGDKIKFIYLKEPNVLRDSVIAFNSMLPQEFELREFADYDTMFDKTFLASVNKLLEVIGWKAEKTNTLTSFFQ